MAVLRTLSMPAVRTIACAVVGACLFSGCETGNAIGDPYFSRVKSTANVYARQSQSGVLKIAVMPFKASTELIGGSVSDMVVTELLRTQKYSLVERSQMNRVLGEAELKLSGLSESKAVEVAKLMGAEGVVIGTVDEYATQAKGGDTYAVVGLSIRLIDCSTAKIIWSADLAKMADDDDTPLATHARNVVHELISGLYQNLVGQVGDLPPPQPMGVDVSDMGLREATVRWTPPQYSAKYRIERSPAEEGPFAAVGEVSASAGSFRDATGLKDGAVYYYRVVPLGKNGGAGDPSAVIETMTAPPPDAPAAVRAAAPSSRCVSLSWTPPRSVGVTEYRIERTTADSGWRAVGTTAAETFTDGGFAKCDLADSTAYRYRVFAVNRVGALSVASAEATVKTLPPPATVASFAAASREIRCVPLSWKPSPEADVTGYEIERSDGEGGAFAALTEIEGREVTSFLDGKKDPGNLPDEHAYRYRIRAVNGVASRSAWAEAKAVTKPAPVKPKGLAATVDKPGKVTVTWTKNPEPDITEYRVEVRGTSGWFWRSLAKTSACDAEDEGLAAGEERIYRVMAVGPKNHESAWSETIQGSARPLPPPPRGLKAVRENGGWRVSFEPPREGMTEFRVYRKKFIGLGMDLLEKTTAHSVLLAPAVTAEGVDIVVTAVDECGLESKPSDVFTIEKG